MTFNKLDKLMDYSFQHRHDASEAHDNLNVLHKNSKVVFTYEMVWRS
jgi:hypothetical protein